MNKRLVKKMMKKRKHFHGVIHASGNKGGDLLDIRDNCDGTIYLHSGHCCVTTIDRVVPVEFLTALLWKVMLDHNNDINAIIDTIDWPESFKTELKAKVKNTY